MSKRLNRPLIVRALLALALLAAQSGAQAHVYSHRLADLERAPATQLCNECLCSASLLTAAGSPQHALVVPRADVAPIAAAARVAAPVPRPFRAFQSRAPPTSL